MVRLMRPPVLALAALLVVVAGCSSSESSGTESQPSTSVAPQTTSSQTTELPEVQTTDTQAPPANARAISLDPERPIAGAEVEVAATGDVQFVPAFELEIWRDGEWIRVVAALTPRRVFGKEPMVVPLGERVAVDDFLIGTTAVVQMPDDLLTGETYRICAFPDPSRIRCGQFRAAGE